MQPKTILFIAGGSYIFGAEEMTLHIIIGLHKKGHKVHVAVNGWNDGSFLKKLVEAGIPHSSIYLGWYYIKKPLWTLDSLWHAPKAIFQFWKLIRENKPDLVYHSSYQTIFLLYPFLKKNNVLSVHDKLSEGRGAFFVQRIDRKINIYTAPSEYILKDLVDECHVAPAKIKVVYNGINFHNNEIPMPNDLKKMDGQVNIGIVGQITFRKGHQTLFTAFRDIASRYPKVMLHVFGKGDTDYMNELKKMLQDFSIEDRVVWHGYITNKDEIYSKVDFCIVPSVKSESFGLVAVEPAAYFKPVIASRIGGLPEIVQDENTGLLFEPGNAGELAQKIDFLLTHPERIHEMGVAAHKEYIRKFSMSRMIDDVELILTGMQ